MINSSKTGWVGYGSQEKMQMGIFNHLHVSKKRPTRFFFHGFLYDHVHEYRAAIAPACDTRVVEV